MWLLGVRYRVEVLQDAVGDQELEVSLAERWSEDTELVGAGASAPAPSRAERAVSYVDAGYVARPRRRCSSTPSAWSCAAGAGSGR